MAKDSSFDVVSQVDMQEMDNAVNQVKKEIDQRYDFRGSNASIELGEKEVKIAAEDEYKLGAILDMLLQKMAKRGIPLRCLVPGKIEPAAKGTVRQSLEIQQGISKENGKKIVAAIKATKLKVTAQIQDDQVRVAGAKKDDLQEVVNRSITQTLSRSLFTSLTTLVMVGALYIWGVTSIRDFALPLMVGIICGAYSSVCVAGALWYVLRKKFAPKAK